jgi:hypothetical protein
LTLAKEIEQTPEYLSQREFGLMRMRAGWPFAFTEDEDLTLQWLIHHLWRTGDEAEQLAILRDSLVIQMKYFTAEELAGSAPLSVEEVRAAQPQATYLASDAENEEPRKLCIEDCFICQPWKCEYLLPPAWTPIAGHWSPELRRQPDKTYLSAMLKDMPPVARIFGQ